MAIFSKIHSVENAGSLRRVHLIIDVSATDGLLAYFPQWFLAEKQIHADKVVPVDRPRNLARFELGIVVDTRDCDIEGSLADFPDQLRADVLATLGSKLKSRQLCDTQVASSNGRQKFSMSVLNEQSLAVTDLPACLNFEPAEGRPVRGLLRIQLPDIFIRFPFRLFRRWINYIPVLISSSLFRNGQITALAPQYLGEQRTFSASLIAENDFVLIVRYGWLVLVAAATIITTIYYDVSWRTTGGRDFFRVAPHIVIYIGGILLSTPSASPSFPITVWCSTRDRKDSATIRLHRRTSWLLSRRET